MQRKICPLFSHNGDNTTKDKTNCGVCKYYSHQHRSIACIQHALLKKLINDTKN